MKFHTIVKTGFAITLTIVAIAGGIQGSVMQAKTIADLAAEQRVAKQEVAALALQNAHLAAEARAIIADFQATLDAATSLIAASDGKADAESRATLAALVSAFETQAAAPFDSATEYRDAAEAMTAESGAAIAEASQVVTDEMSAWQAAEDSRIAAEQAAAAAKAAAKKPAAPPARGGGGATSNNAGGGAAPSAPGGGGGTPPSTPPSSSGRAWAEGIVNSIVPGVPVSWDYQQVAGTYGGMYSNGTIYLSNGVADGSRHAYSIIVHEATHAGAQIGSCREVWRGHFGGDPERFTQAYTLARFGTTVGAYAYPTNADLDAVRSC